MVKGYILVVERNWLHEHNNENEEGLIKSVKGGNTTVNSTYMLHSKIHKACLLYTSVVNKQDQKH